MYHRAWAPDGDTRRHCRTRGDSTHLADGASPCLAVFDLALRSGNQPTPSVEVPLGDFFCCGWGVRCQVNSLPVAVNPAGGFNCYWEMPFRQHARITLENLAPDPVEGFYYQMTYVLTTVPDDAAYLHAQWRRSNPLPYMQVHPVLAGVQGQGHYVGTYMAWGTHNNGWWGEGEMKFYLDGDTERPSICGTGTGDYFGGAWCFINDAGTGTPRTRRRSWGCRRCSCPMATIAASRALVCIAGMYRIHLLSARLARHRASAGLACAPGGPATLLTLARRHCLDGLLVPERATRAVSHLTRSQCPGSDIAT